MAAKHVHNQKNCNYRLGCYTYFYFFFVLQVSGSQITLLERGEFSRRMNAGYVPPHISFSMRKHQVGKTFIAKLILV